MRILVTGASGFAGSLLAPRLLSGGHEIVALARDPARVDVERLLSTIPEGPEGARRGATRGCGREMEVLAADALTGEGLARALHGVEVAYYLIHSMEAPGRAAARQAHGPVPFPERERIAAENFASAASHAGVRRVVYLGGPVASWSATPTRAASSRHLASREAVEHILRAAIPDTVVLRASIVIGARSRSFRFLVRLVERMPVLALPAWRSYRTRPIDARDVIEMLAAAATVDAVAARSLDVGGPDILSYREMIERIAESMLVARPAVGLSVSVTPLVARVAAAIAEEDPELTTALMESLQGDLLPGGVNGRAHLRAAELLGVELHSFDSAVEHALREWEEAEPLAAR
ncbi:MAG TPA: NAD-dependent epimerase/dehydratase family protein [Solirubrobacteraceae bacterium]|nr:NAD-dependent epimerase/dehydratase family protein [Solirubrobacteraceae bacterium]